MHDGDSRLPAKRFEEGAVDHDLLQPQDKRTHQRKRIKYSGGMDKRFRNKSGPPTLFVRKFGWYFHTGLESRGWDSRFLGRSALYSNIRTEL